jgi:NADPH2:quinone reductase
MKAAVLTEQGVAVRDVPQPQPKPTQVLVRVRACGLNRADLVMASGQKHGAMGGAGAIAGMEAAGEIAEVGTEAADFKPGDRVMCAGSATFAEYAAIDFGRAIRIPVDMTFERAATLPIALNTMHDALITNGRLRAGESVLIQGASTGVGLMGLQIAKLKGARVVIGTSTHAERRGRLGEFGADLALDSRDPTWVEAVTAATSGGVDLIIDMLSGYVANQNMQAVKVLGRIVNIGRLGGMTGEFDYDLHSRKRIAYIGASFRTRSIEEIREINRRMRAELWEAVMAGTLHLPIDRTFPLDRIEAALAHARANRHFGKIVLTV